jgi:uncharacterized protein DUF1569
MTDLETALAANRAAVDELLAAGEKCGPSWNTARAPGKWSPSQISEHVARALEESSNAMNGVPSKFPNLPAFLRPVLRALVFNRVVRGGSFPKGRTNKAMNPISGPATPAAARARFAAVLDGFDKACRKCSASDGVLKSTVFGKVPIVDYVRFQECHVRHHQRQMPIS